MIFTAILIQLNTLLAALISVLPTATLPNGVTTAISTVGDYFGLVGWLFPLDTLFQIVTIGLGIELAILGFKWGVWLYNKIRGSG
jgi:hypothetical protein